MQRKSVPKTICLVDDEKGVLEELGLWLQEFGYRVKAFNNGFDALKAVVESPPDLILLDLMMPGIDGFEVLRELKRNQKTCNIPVVLLTARPESEAIMKAQQLRAADYVIKPFNPDELLSVVERCRS